MIWKGYSTALFGWSERWKLDGKEADWDEIFDECAKSGLHAVELSGTRLDWIGQVQRHGLQVSAIYTGYSLHESGLSGQLQEELLPIAEKAASIACTDLLVNAQPKGSWGHPERKDEDELKRQGELLGRMAEWVEPYGMKICMHNHAKYLPQSIDDLRSVTDYADKKVGLCVDTGWAHVSGMDPIAWIQSYPERIFALHLRNQRGEIPTEDLSEGDISIQRMVQALETIGYSGWMSLELWHREDTRAQGTMTEAVRRSLELLESQN